MIAQLGMYDMPAIQAANDRLWSAIRTELGYGPAELDRSSGVWDVWTSPDLVVAQTCGYPYRARLHGQVQLVGTPDYGLEGCPPGHYCSVIVARQDASDALEDFDGARFAYNEALSQSGWAAPVTHLLAKGIHPGALVETGGHALSAKAVAEDRADFAGLDALTWALLQSHDTDLANQLRVIDRTNPTPTLPYITALGRDAEHVRRAIKRAITTLDPQAKTALHLRGLIDIPSAAYLAIPNPPPPEEMRTKPA